MMISAVGRKKSTAASTHRLIEGVPLCAAAAIQRGPSTAAMLNSNTSQKPMARRSCDLGARVSSAISPFPLPAWVMERHHSILTAIGWGVRATAGAPGSSGRSLFRGRRNFRDDLDLEDAGPQLSGHEQALLLGIVSDSVQHRVAL